MFTAQHVRDYIDYQVSGEMVNNPIKSLEILNAMDKAVDGQELTDKEARLCAEGFVWYSNQFPFSMSWQLGAKHFVKSETFGLELYRVDGGWSNTKGRKIVCLGVVAIVNEDRSGWKLV